MKRQVFVDADGDLPTAYRSSVEEMNAALTRPDLRVGVGAQRNGAAPDFLAD